MLGTSHLLTAVAGYAQTPVVPVQLEKQFGQTLLSSSGTPLHPAFRVEGQWVLLPGDIDVLDGLLLADRQFSGQFDRHACILSVPSKLTMERCRISQEPEDSSGAARLLACGEDGAAVRYQNDVEIYHCRFDSGAALRLSLGKGVYGRIGFDTLWEMHVTSEKQALLIATNNRWRSDLSVDKADMDILNVVNGDFGSDTARSVVVSSSHVNTFLFVDNVGKDIQVELAYDTLTAAIEFISNVRVTEFERQKAHLLVTISHCLISAPIVSGFIRQKSKLVFEDCMFGPGANMSNLGFDTIVFKGCFNIPSPVLLSSDTTLQTVALSFVNSNFNNIKFDYRGKYQLFFDSVDRKNNDLVSGTYENLLAKFKLEGKIESYKNIDIEYQQYKDAQNGIAGWLKDEINRAWWYYSYRKYYILYWTAGFLLAFFVWNVLIWEKMQCVYPIMKEEKKSPTPLRRPPRQTGSSSCATIFIFTVLIFFSIRIDLSKLSYKNTGMVSIFFVQYTVGLACMFFIVNAILKI